MLLYGIVENQRPSLSEVSDSLISTMKESGRTDVLSKLILGGIKLAPEMAQKFGVSEKVVLEMLFTFAALAEGKSDGTNSS